MRLLRMWFAPSVDASIEKIRDGEINRLSLIIEDMRRERENYRRESLYWRDKFMTLMGVGDMSYPAMGAAQEVPKEEEQEPTHVSLIGLRARHELESKQRAREMEREKKA